MLKTEEERAGVLKILVCDTISFLLSISPRPKRIGGGEKGQITADVLMRS